MPTLGFDIGGANLKAATSDGRAAAVAFPLWKTPDQLAEALARLRDQLPNCDRLAVTMTGELADCFATKAEGVSRILDAVESLSAGRLAQVWSTAGEFLEIMEARAQWKQVAAANWHALATWAGQFAPQGCALIVDVGSTTTDIIPLQDGVPCPLGRTDGERLLSGELVYTGVRRTPLCAVSQSVEWRGKTCGIAAELFATMLDAHLINGRIAPDDSDNDTADGRPATVERAFDRMARMVCCDRSEISVDELTALAQQFVAAQAWQIQAAVRQVTERLPQPASIVMASGSGAFLARRVLGLTIFSTSAERIDLDKKFSPEIAEAACAHAVACLDHNASLKRC